MIFDICAEGFNPVYIYIYIGESAPAPLSYAIFPFQYLALFAYNAAAREFDTDNMKRCSYVQLVYYMCIHSFYAFISNVTPLTRRGSLYDSEPCSDEHQVFSLDPFRISGIVNWFGRSRF